MMEGTWLAALLLGLASSGHCAGMCGSIVGTLALAPGARARPLAFTLAYHAGRASSYAAAGAIVGALGQAGLLLRGSLGVQQTLFAIASVGLLVAGAALAGYAPVLRRVESAGAGLWRRIEPWSRPLIPARTALQAGLLGMLWGWLPCGMVYAALLLALGSGDAGRGALTMALFATGTLPGLVALGWFARKAAGRRADRRLRVASGVAIAAVGLYGILQLLAHGTALADFCRLPLGD